jgi:aspartyl-tRNA(Asn)/glutamyl-tRNA(Gln) amidotransferase subunit B
MAESPYQIVIGLEVHVQLLTQTKLFCGCSTKFGLPPNSATCPVCIGMPGTLPVMNRRAFDLALQAALALNCQIAPFTKWDRKNYYYPDLPKNYQISQYDLPFSHDGWLEIEGQRIGIIRVHLEEDAGKMLHDEQGGGKNTLVDLNRAGTPLLEIVSQPDLTSPEQAKAYLEELRLLLRELGISDCEMQEGSLRCDANVNIHIPQPDGSYVATPLVEVKNLNSFRAVERALKYEAQRQFDENRQAIAAGTRQVRTEDPKPFGPDRRLVCKIGELKNGKLVDVAKATAGWDDGRGVTVIQRRKEEASDYRYFPEPDLVPVTVGPSQLDKAKAALGELPAAQRARLQAQYGLSAYDAGVLTHQGRAVVAYFEQTARLCDDSKAACNWVTNQVLATLNERKATIQDFPLSAGDLAGLIKQIQSSGLNMQRAREVYAHMLQHGGTAEQAIDRLGVKPVGDESQLREMIGRAIAANPKAVADFKKGKVKAIDAIKGAVMRETKGKANTELLQQILMQEVEKM